jgi:hypothetical protein
MRLVRICQNRAGAHRLSLPTITATFIQGLPQLCASSHHSSCKIPFRLVKCLSDNPAAESPVACSCRQEMTSCKNRRSSKAYSVILDVHKVLWIEHPKPFRNTWHVDHLVCRHTPGPWSSTVCLLASLTLQLEASIWLAAGE